MVWDKKIDPNNTLPPRENNLDPKAWSKKVKAKKLEGNSPEPQGSIFGG